MGCRSCGGRQAPPDPNRGIEGRWSVRWPHGALQGFDTEAEALKLVASRPDLPFDVLPPAHTVLDDDPPPAQHPTVENLAVVELEGRHRGL